MYVRGTRLRNGGVVRCRVSLLVSLLCAAPALARPDAEWIASCRERLQEAAGAADPSATLPGALKAVAGALREHRSSVRKVSELDPILAAIERASRSAHAETRREAWAAAAASGAPAGLAILETGMKQAKSHPAAVMDMLDAIRMASNGPAHSWMLVRVERVRAWAYSLSGTKLEAAWQLFEHTLDACVASVGESKDAEARTVAKELSRALRETTGATQADVAAATARSPAPAVRKILRTWIAKAKKLPDATLIAVLQNLPLAGDDAAVPIIMGQLRETQPAVLEAALLAFWNLKPKILRARGKAIVRETAKLVDAEYRERRVLTQRGRRSPKQEARLEFLNARQTAWVSAKLEDSPPKPLPSGAQGILGFTALWWRIVDLEPKGMRAPQPAKNARLKYLSNRAQLSWDAWMSWAKKGR